MSILPWQQSQWDLFSRLFSRQTLPHAVLFHGPKGVGKFTFAQSFAHTLLCQAGLVNQGGCGDCASCALIQAGNHPDIRVLDSAQEGKDLVTVNQIRAVNEFLWLTPHASQRKVLIIRLAEHMNTAAANGLLKILEEPPQSSILILLSQNVAALLATVRSRCQLFRFTVPEAALAQTWLCQQVDDLSVETSQLLLALAEGAPLLALQHERSNTVAVRKTLLDIIAAVPTKQQDPIAAASELGKLDIKVVLYWLASLVVDMVRLKAVPHPPALTNIDLVERLQKASNRFELKVLLDFQQKIVTMSQHMKNNANTQLMLEELMLDWMSMFRGR